MNRPPGRGRTKGQKGEKKSASEAIRGLVRLRFWPFFFSPFFHPFPLTSEPNSQARTGAIRQVCETNVGKKSKPFEGLRSEMVSLVFFVFLLSLTQIDLVTVSDAILTGRETRLEITVFLWKSDVK